jgi:hypothetical protein
MATLNFSEGLTIYPKTIKASVSSPRVRIE